MARAGNLLIKNIKYKAKLSKNEICDNDDSFEEYEKLTMEESTQFVNIKFNTF